MPETKSDMVLVPREPTRIWLEDFCKRVDDFSREHAVRLFARDLWASVIAAATPAPAGEVDEPLDSRDMALIDAAWENYKAAAPVAIVINDNQPGRTAIIEIMIDPPTLVVGTKLYAERVPFQVPAGEAETPEHIEQAVDRLLKPMCRFNVPLDPLAKGIERELRAVHAALSAEREARQKAERERDALVRGGRHVVTAQGKLALDLEARATKLAEALRGAAERFREYELLHRGKGNADADRKAEANAAMAAACEAALSDAPEAQGWRPIESAPKDGKPILLTGMKYGPNLTLGRWGSGRYLGRKRGYNRTWVDQSGEEIDPTHWMPAPPPPAQGEG